MASKFLSKKPENWGKAPQVKKLSTENVEPNRTRIEAKTAEMKAALEAKFKKS